MAFSRSSSSSTITIAAPPFPPLRMQSESSHEYPARNQLDSAPGPSQANHSQRCASQMMPAQASSVGDALAYQPQQATFDATSRGWSPPRFIAPTTPSLPMSRDTTPLKSSMRLSHPPPPPSLSHIQSMTPQSKRARLTDADTYSAISGTSPLSASSSTSPHQPNGSSSSTGPLSSPSLSNIRPLSGISRPLPLPPTPSPSQRPPLSTTRNVPLIPLPQRSINDLQKLLPPRPPPAPRSAAQDSPRRALMQVIPPRPPTLQAQHLPVRPPSPAVETLPGKRGWSLTGFRSFDVDVGRIAEVVQREQARVDGSSELQALENGTNLARPHFGLADRGLPSGSILEVLGPPGSGKSSFVLQFAVTERLRALGRARESLSRQDDADGSRDESSHGTGTFDDSKYFTEEFWDAEVACADQVLIIDCEGALSPERIADAVWTAVSSLWVSVRDRRPSASSTEAETFPASNSALPQQRSAMPEEVRRLVAAALAGIHVSRVTSLAGFIALLHSLRPTDEMQEGSPREALPTALPPRTSLILVDSLSYYIRSSGGDSQHRKFTAQMSERIRDMLLRLQKPFEYRSQPGLPAEEQEATRQRCLDAAAKLCTPTIVFTNQLGIKKSRNETDASGRASPSSWQSTGPGSSRSFNRNNARSEGTSMLAPLLNGTRPTQPARIRDERPAPSVALNGPEMWDDHEQPMSSPRQVQQLNGRSVATQPMGHDRGWPPSFLGQDVWRILLFRHGSFGDRYAQMVSIPPAVQSELSMLWAQTRERMRVRAGNRAETAQRNTAQRAEADPPADERMPLREPSELQNEQATTSAALPDADLAEKQDRQMLELLRELRASLFRWRPFHVSSRGLVS